MALLLLHPGYDTTEGSDHAAAALHWLETGRLGQPTQPSGVYARGVDGLYYTAHEFGAVLWQLPAASAGLAAEAFTGVRNLPGISMRLAMLVMSFGSILVSVATAAGFWKWLEWRGGTPLALRMAASTLLILATTLLPYAAMLSDVGVTGAWLVWGAAFGARAGRSGTRWAAAAAGFCYGLAVMTRIPSIVAAAPMFLVMLASTPRDRRWTVGAIAVTAALPCLAATLWYNEVRTGSPLVPVFLVPAFEVVRPGSGSLLTGISGLLASPGKSIFVFSPALLLGAAGFPRLWRSAPIDAAGVAAVFASFILAHGSLESWHADWGWGPRHFLFVLPLVWLPAAVMLGDLPRGSFRRRASLALIAVSLAVQSVALSVNWHYQYQWMFADGRLTSATPWRMDNQMTDAMRAAPGNIARTLGANVPPPRAPMVGASRATVIAATGVNVWWMTALRCGVSPVVIWPPVMAMAFGVAAAWRQARRAIARSQ